MTVIARSKSGAVRIGRHREWRQGRVAERREAPGTPEPARTTTAPEPPPPGACAKPTLRRTRRCTAAAAASCSRRTCRPRSGVPIAVTPRPGSAQSDRTAESSAAPAAVIRRPPFPHLLEFPGEAPLSGVRRREQAGEANMPRDPGRMRRAGVRAVGRAGLHHLLPGHGAPALQRRPVLDQTGREPDPARFQSRAQAQPGRVHGADGAEPPVRAPQRQVLRQDPAGQRDPPASRGLAEHRHPERGEGNSYGGLLPFHGLRRGEDDRRVPAWVTATSSAPRTCASSTT